MSMHRVDETQEAGFDPSSRRGVGAVLGLSALGIGKPILDTLQQAPDFFLLYRLGNYEIIALVVVLLLGPGLAVIAVMAFIRWIAPFAALWHWTGAIGLLAMAAALTLWRQSGLPPSGWLALLACGFCGLAVAGGAVASDKVRQFLSYLALAVPVLGIAFFWQADTDGETPGPRAQERLVRFPRDASGLRSNILVVVFDELPLTSLLDAEGQINTARFPAFAEFAKTAYWFRNASSVACATSVALPSILSGRYPPPLPTVDVPPTAENYPANLLTFFADTHEVSALEPVTGICPDKVCPQRGAADGIERWLSYGRLISHLAVAYLHAIVPEGLAAGLPDLESWWIEAGAQKITVQPPDAGKEAIKRGRKYEARAQSIDTFVRTLGTAASPWLTFAHFLLPHTPMEYSYDGKLYFKGRSTYGMGKADQKAWGDNEAHIYQNYFRHIEQARYTDTVVGRIVARLREANVYDNTLVAFVSDHGVNFRPRQPRRQTTAKNYPRLLGVPFLLKLPGQQKGEVIDRNIELVDLVPTVIAALGGQPLVALDGRNALNPDLQERPNKKNFCRGKDYMSYPSNLLPHYAEEAALIESYFGDHSNPSPSLRVGPHLEWLGRDAAEIGVVAGSKTRLTLFEASRVDDVDLRGESLPLHLNGIVRPPSEAGRPRILVTSINGRIASVMPTVFKGKSEVFSVMIDRSFLVQGYNALDVYEPVDKRAGEIELLRLAVAVE